MTNKNARWTSEHDEVLKQTMPTKKMAKLLGRTHKAVQQRRNILGIKFNISPSERAKLSWKTRYANMKKATKATNSIDTKTVKQDKVLKSKSDFKFILNGIPVTIGANVKNAHVGIDRIEVNF